MALTFDNLPVAGTHGPVLTLPPALQTKRTKFFGVKGESEIRGERGGRYIYTDIWLHDEYTSAAELATIIDELDVAVGTHGDLDVSGEVPRTYENCTFEGFTPIEPGIMPDLTTQLDGIGDVTYWCAGRLTWFQLHAPG